MPRMSAEQITGLPGFKTESASGSNHKRSAPAVSSTNTIGLSFGLPSAVSTQIGSQTRGSDSTSSTWTRTLPDCTRAMIFDGAGFERDTPSSESSAIGVRSTFLDLFNVNGDSLWSDRTTLPDSVTYRAGKGSGFTGGSSRTGVLSFFSQRENQL